MDAEGYLGLNDLKQDVVKDVPVWGDVWVQALDGAEREEVESLTVAAQAGKATKFSLRATVVAFSVISGEGGTKVFNRTHIPRLMKKSAEALDMIVDGVLEVSAMDKATRAAIAKNSETVPADASGSSSPGLSPTPVLEEPKG